MRTWDLGALTRSNLLEIECAPRRYVTIVSGFYQIRLYCASPSSSVANAPPPIVRST
jgi:hypothetical protein